MLKRLHYIWLMKESFVSCNHGGCLVFIVVDGITRLGQKNKLFFDSLNI